MQLNSRADDASPVEVLVDVAGAHAAYKDIVPAPCWVAFDALQPQAMCSVQGIVRGSTSGVSQLSGEWMRIVLCDTSGYEVVVVAFNDLAVELQSDDDIKVTHCLCSMAVRCAYNAWLHTHHAELSLSMGSMHAGPNHVCISVPCVCTACLCVRNPITHCRHVSLAVRALCRWARHWRSDVSGPRLATI